MRRDDRAALRRGGGVPGGPGGADDPHAGDRRARTVLVILLLASFIVITLDARRSSDSPVDVMRSAAGAVFGPLETGAATVTSPVTGLVDYLGDVQELREANEALRARNDRLHSRLRSRAFVNNRDVELDRLLGAAREQDQQVVPAQVTAIGAGQSFSRTVTIDAGRRDGVRPDMTVLNGQGLVGRVISATSTTASVLLLIDPDSVVGGRLGGSMELGFISGEGDIGEEGRLRMQLVDRLARPKAGDSVVTWGSRKGVPYVAGVPIGSVEKVRTSPRELSKNVVIEPYVDFSSLDLVGVVTADDRRPRRATASAAQGGPR
jgi:rod shape-determining protein MreC